MDDELSEKLLEACKAAKDWLEHAPIDYSNGVTHQGMDEGNVLGWRYHGELIEQLSAVIGEAEDTQEGGKNADTQPV